MMPEEDWSAAPSDVLELISKRLLSWDDYVRFRSVCTSWRSAAPKRPHIPLLLVSEPPFVPAHSLELCNFPNTELYIPPHLPQRRQRGTHALCGSSRGWIFFKDSTPTPINLRNPFTGVHIQLPVLPCRSLPFKVILSADPAIQPHDCIVMAECHNLLMFLPFKVILSADPAIHPHDCIVMAQCHNLLMFYCRPGDASWINALNNYPDSARDGLQDTVLYQEKFYVVSRFYRLFACQVGPGNASFVEVLPADPFFPCGRPTNTGTYSKRYLVVSSGDLLLVVITETDCKVTGCEVFRVDFDDGRFRLFKLENIGGRALFLSPLSNSLSADPHNCRGNCIYYAGCESKIVVYHMEDKNISYIADGWRSLKLWFTPSLCS